MEFTRGRMNITLPVDLVNWQSNVNLLATHLDTIIYHQFNAKLPLNHMIIPLTLLYQHISTIERVIASFRTRNLLVEAYSLLRSSLVNSSGIFSIDL